MWKYYPVRLGLSPGRRWGPAPRVAPCRGMPCDGKEWEGRRMVPHFHPLRPCRDLPPLCSDVLLLPLRTGPVSVFPSHTRSETISQAVLPRCHKLWECRGPRGCPWLRPMAAEEAGAVGRELCRARDSGRALQGKSCSIPLHGKP